MTGTGRSIATMMRRRWRLDKTNDVLTADDRAFLTDLGNKLKTQERLGTAKPVIYQIRERIKELAADPDYADGMALALGEDADVYYEDDIAEAKERLLDEFEWDDAELRVIHEASTLKALADFYETAEITHHYTGYCEVERYTGFFLTNEALQTHVKANRHHYKNPVSYAHYAGFRNPELERLLAIVEKFATVEEVAE